MRLRLALLGSFAVLGMAAPAAQAVEVWSPATFDFGSKSVGSTTPATFQLTAICDATSGFPNFTCLVPASGVHNVGTPTVIGDDFTLAPADNGCGAGVLIHPSNGLVPVVCGLVLRFTPNSPGLKTGSLNLPTGPDVALSGTGVETGERAAALAKCKKKKKKKARKKCRAKAQSLPL